MITILSGSPRAGSNTIKVARAIKRVCAEKGYADPVTIIDFNQYDIPSAAQGTINPDQLTPWQQTVVNSMSHSELVFLLSPEYNWLPSPEVINFINVMTGSSFKTMWDNKVFALVGVSSGRGGRMPAVQLSYVINKVINVQGLESMVAPKVFDAQFAPQVLDAEGESTGNAEFDNGLGVFVEHTMKIALRWHR